MPCRSPTSTFKAASLLGGAASLLAFATPAGAQDSAFERTAESVARQPIKDIGLLREQAAPLLLAAQKAPYSLKGLQGCTQLAAAIAELDAVLGPDIDTLDSEGNTLASRLAQEGARSLLASLIPFRGFVREVSGAADADRKLRVAVATGVARRAYLKGVAFGKGCKRPG